MNTSPDDLADLLVIARLLIEERRDRDPRFGGGLFADPAWELLLAVYVREAEGLAIFTEALETSTSVPASTARRWIRMLIDRDLLEMEREDDAKRPVRLTAAALGKLETHFRTIRKGLAAVQYRLH